MPPRSTVELFLDNRWCIDSTWLYIFSTSPEGCFLEMQDRSNCSNTYVNYGTGGHCGCVANDTDCATSNGESTAKVYRAAGTTTSQVVRFAGQEARLAVTTSNPPPPETVSLDSSLSASVVVAGPAGRAGEDGWWPRGDPSPAGTTARFVMEEAALFASWPQRPNLTRLGGCYRPGAHAGLRHVLCKHRTGLQLPSGGRESSC